MKAKTHFGLIGPIRKVLTFFTLNFFKKILCNNFSNNLLQITTQISKKKISKFGPIGPIQFFMLLHFFKKSLCNNL